MIREGSGLVTALSLISLPVAAHHSRAIYDRERVVTIEGVVTKYEWRNPHVHVFVETEIDTGDAVVWTFDTGTTTAAAIGAASTNVGFPATVRDGHDE